MSADRFMPAVLGHALFATAAAILGQTTSQMIKPELETSTVVPFLAALLPGGLALVGMITAAMFIVGGAVAKDFGPKVAARWMSQRKAMWVAAGCCASAVVVSIVVLAWADSLSSEQVILGACLCTSLMVYGVAGTLLFLPSLIRDSGTPTIVTGLAREIVRTENPDIAEEMAGLISDVWVLGGTTWRASWDAYQQEIVNCAETESGALVLTMPLAVFIDHKRDALEEIASGVMSVLYETAGRLSHFAVADLLFLPAPYGRQVVVDALRDKFERSLSGCLWPPRDAKKFLHFFILWWRTGNYRVARNALIEAADRWAERTRPRRNNIFAELPSTLSGREGDLTALLTAPPFSYRTVLVRSAIESGRRINRYPLGEEEEAGE